ncbi:type IV secretion system DNA-binding domain-containing protein [Alteromonas lipotrueae]|uniref:type IV secretion system DNA-binding domain-containing protein n=1 Tax=Alteromonas lipotrueae TaxID=2803814 RepID=UPI001C45A434|nr:type IV secretion system DNA-binding domain-containing protein [Alteromonas lipotrueae]
MSTQPASQRRQDWATVLLMAALVGVPTFIGLLIWTWSWLMPWPAIDVHAQHWLGGITGFLFDQSLAPWLSYWQALVERDWHLAFVGHISVALAIAALLAFMIARRFYVHGGNDGYRHIEGARRYLYATALRHAKRVYKQEKRKAAKPPKGKSYQGLHLHPKLRIPRHREQGNLLVIGNQGSGKTVVLTPMMHGVIERGERAFIYDEKREFTSLFYQPETTVLLAPWDTRSTPWDIQSDAYNANLAQLISERMIKETRDPLWSSGARMLFTGMIEILNHTQARWGWRELANILSLDDVTLHSQLEAYYPRAARFIVEGSKTTQSFFAQLIGSLGWIYTLAEAWPKAYDDGFCLRDWVVNPDTDKPVLIIQADKRYKEIGAPLCNALIALMTSHTLALTNAPNRELWLFIDELGNLPKNPALLEWMSTGRSKGARIVAGTQSIAQIKRDFEGEEAEAMLNMFTMFICMRIGAVGETSSEAAEVFGERVVERLTSSAGQGESTTPNWHRETLPLVTEADLVQLPQSNKKGVEGFMLLPSYEGIYRLRWPYPKQGANIQEHCPAAWVDKRPELATKTTEDTDTGTSARVVDKLKARKNAA